VIDVDPRNGGDVSWKQHMAVALYDDTAETRTGSGGSHLIFAYPDDGLGLKGGSGWLPGVDVKSNDGYIVAPPSTHASGDRYEWVRDQKPIPAPLHWNLTRVSDDGVTLVDELRSWKRSSKRDGKRAGDTPKFYERERNNSLTSLGGTMRRRNFGPIAIERALLAENEDRCIPPLEDDEVKLIAQSVSRYTSEAEAEVGRKVDEALAVVEFKVMSTRALLDLEPPSYLIDGILPEGSLAVLWGAPTTYKTFVALDWSYSLFHGIPWLGRDVKQAQVMYVIGEGVRSAGLRVDAWHRWHGRAVPTDEDNGVWLHSGGVNLTEPGVFEAIRDRALETGSKLIVFDTLARMMFGLDENDAGDVGRVVKVADKMRENTGAAVLFAHHARKDGTAYRGSTALVGAADTVIHAIRNEKLYAELECEKQKDDDEFEPMLLTLGVQELGRSDGRNSLVIIDGGRRLTPKEKSKDAIAATAIETVRDKPDEFTKTDLVAYIKGGDDHVKRGVVDDLIDGGRLKPVSVIRENSQGHRRPTDVLRLGRSDAGAGNTGVTVVTPVANPQVEASPSTESDTGAQASSAAPGHAGGTVTPIGNHRHHYEESPDYGAL
jgi:hypothetical protein